MTCRSTSVRQDLLARQYDREAVHEIFDNLQFRVLRERLLETFDQEDETELRRGFDIDGGRLAPGAVRGWLAAHAYAAGSAWSPRHVGRRWRRRCTGRARRRRTGQR